MFTNYYKAWCKFGVMYNSRSLTIPTHTDFIYDSSGSKRYFNKKFPCYMGASSPTINFFTAANSLTTPIGWYGVTAQMTDDGVSNYSGAPMTYLSAALDENDDIKLNMSINNTTSASIQINSLVFFSQVYSFQSESAVGYNLAYTPLMYVNLDAPIDVPANDSILLTITFSAGDVSDVSVG